MYTIAKRNHSKSINNVAGEIQTGKAIGFATAVTKRKWPY